MKRSILYTFGIIALAFICNSAVLRANDNDIFEIAYSHSHPSEFDGSRLVAGKQQITHTETRTWYATNSSGETIVGGPVRNTGEPKLLWGGLAEIRQMPALMNEGRGHSTNGFCGYYATFNAVRLAKNEHAYITNRHAFVNDFYAMLQWVKQNRRRAPYDALFTLEMSNFLRQQQLDNDLRLLILGLDNTGISVLNPNEDWQPINTFKYGIINELIIILGAYGHATTIHVERPNIHQPYFLRFSVYDSLSDDWYMDTMIERKITPLYQFLTA